MGSPVLESFWIEGPLQHKIRVRSWKTNDATKSLLVVHGYSEHSLCYLPLVDFFSNNQFNVYSFDHLGHGQSEGVRSRIDDFEHYLETLDAVHKRFSADWLNQDLYCMGHSLGGLIALRYVQTRAFVPWKKLALSSPLLGLYGFSYRVLPWLKILTSALPNISWESESKLTSALTHDEDRVRERLADPLIRPRISIPWVREILKARERAFQEIDRVKIPVGLFQAGDERITDKLEARRFGKLLFERNQSSGLIKEYEGWYHELSNEVQRLDFFSDLAAWLRR